MHIQSISLFQSDFRIVPRVLDKIEVMIMISPKAEVQAILDKLPDDCSLEDIQYHLYVAEKINKGIDRTKKEGTLTQDEVEGKLSKWLSK